jgi:hypothetical protein
MEKKQYIMIGIAIALAVIFREAIGNLLRELINMITGKAKTAIE